MISNIWHWICGFCVVVWHLIFPKPEPPVPPTPVEGNRIGLFFAIDIYPDPRNNLPDCVLDQKHRADFFASKYPEFKILKFCNSAVTVPKIREIITNQVMALKSGDILDIFYSGHGTQGVNPAEPDGYSEGIYLADGQVFWDQEWQRILPLIPEGAKVSITLDSCFAHGSTETKSLNSKKAKNGRKVRYVQTQVIPVGMKRAKSVLKGEMANYVVLAACGENQTSESTGRGGVFSLHLLEAWKREFTWSEWSNKTAALLKSDNEEQIPNAEGDVNLLVEQIYT